MRVSVLVASITAARCVLLASPRQQPIVAVPFVGGGRKRPSLQWVAFDVQLLCFKLPYLSRAVLAIVVLARDVLTGINVACLGSRTSLFVFENKKNVEKIVCQ